MTADVLSLPGHREPAKSTTPDPAGVIRAERGRLPAARTYPCDLGDQVAYATIGIGASWPVITVLIRLPGTGLTAQGRFRPDGTVAHIGFDADDHDSVTPADFRRAAVTRALQDCGDFGREVARRILAGEPDPDTITGVRTPADAVRTLAHGPRRTAGTRRRGAAREQLLRDLASAYRDLVADHHPAPRHVLAEQFGYTVSHIARLLGDARHARPGRLPLLGPAIRGKAGESARPASTATRTETRHAA